MERRFAYHRAVAPMMWVLAALASVELLVTHMLVAFWRVDVALALSAATLVGIVWLASAIGSFRRLPVLLDDERLLLRAGRIKSISVPLADVAGLRRDWPPGTPKRRDVLNLALIAHPNILVDLRRPRPGRRAIVGIAHRLDDPSAFASALEPLLAAR